MVATGGNTHLVAIDLRWFGRSEQNHVDVRPAPWATHRSRADAFGLEHVVDLAFTTNATAAHSSPFLASRTIPRTGWPAICKVRASSPPTFPLIRVIAYVVLNLSIGSRVGHKITARGHGRI